MSVHVKVVCGLLIAGILAIIGARFALPELRSAWQQSTSDAADLKGHLKIGIDSWVGYVPLCSSEMIKRMRHVGYSLECIDDKADYNQRFKDLASRRLDLAVTTIDAYLKNGAAHDFPGAIIAVIDESRGGDAIVANPKAIASLEALRQRADARIAFTPGSPSEHLLQAVILHFDLPFKAGQGSWSIAADGSSDALRKLSAGKADVAVLWEPDVSRAINDFGHVKLIGTEDTQGLIVDVLLASRRLLKDSPEAVQALLSQYFNTLQAYQRDPRALQSQVAETTGVSAKDADTMLDGVDWKNLDENGAFWFGVTPSGLPGREGLIDSIRNTAAILQDSRALDRSPLPDNDPYRLTNKQFVSELYLAQGASGHAQSQKTGRDFSALDDAGWAALRDVGTLKVEPVSFSRGTATLDASGQETIDRIAHKLAHYPNFRILIKGHTGLNGDAQANLALSRDRAAAVADDLLGRHRLDPDRIRAMGFGSSRPLPRLPGESSRAYSYRLPRVEVTLVGEP